MSRLPTPAHVASWARFAPGVKESAGRKKGNGATGHGNRLLWNRLRTSDSGMCVRKSVAAPQQSLPGWFPALRAWWGSGPVRRRGMPGRNAGRARRRVYMGTQQVTSFTSSAEGELVAVEVDGTAVAVTVLDGELLAFQDTCPHAGCSLADGEVEDQAVVCPCHFARFDLKSGAVLAGSTTSGVATWSARLTGDVLELDGPREPGPAPRDSQPQVASRSGPARDITVLIEREHEAVRRQFAALEDHSDLGVVSRASTVLTELLEIHASGEETVLYPELVRSTVQGVQDTDHAVRDHNDIRDAVRAVQNHEVGSAPWWDVVRVAGQENGEHLTQEEREVLPPFRESVGMDRREQLGDQWLAFHDQHEKARGLSGQDTDPRAVIEASPRVVPPAQG